MAVATHLHKSGHVVSIWEHNPQEAQQLARTRERHNKLPGFRLPASIQVTDMASAITRDADVVLLVTPTSAIGSTAAMVAAVRPRARVVVCLAKGMEVGTGRRMTEVIAEQLPAIPIVALTGPSHAEEVVRGVPTAVVAASDDRAAAERIQSLFSGETFRVYTSDDVVGVEVAAALKNIIAIAAGIADGLGYESADNLKGALLTRGLTEISRLGIRMGAKPETFAGLAGIGDLVTTCLSRHSRNRHVGEQIGRGRTLEETLAAMSMVAEGVNTTRAAVVLAQRLEVKMPIAEAVHRVLNGETHPREALTELMLRPLRSEMPLDAPA